MKPRLLLVDDDPNVIKALMRTLHGEPYEILSAINDGQIYRYLTKPCNSLESEES